MTLARPWSFRAKLATLIAAVFIAGGAVLLTVQFLLVQRLFAEGISTISTGCIVSEGSSDGQPRTESELACEIVSGPDAGTESGEQYESIVTEQTTQLSEEVLSGLLGWSIVVLIGFAALAASAGWWLSRRSLGRIAAVIATTREITRGDLHRRLELEGPRDEIKELGDTIDGMLDRLDDAFQRQERFIASASHELRTPLTTTRALLEIPLEQGRVPAELEPTVRQALEANARSERLIAALLTLAYAVPRTPDDDTPATPLDDVVAEALAEGADAIAAKQLAVLVDVPPLAARADPALLGIAVGNVISNAVRHNRPAGRLEVTGEVEGEHLRLIVGNDGAPLTQAEVARFTEPFHRGSGTRLAGPGLGLGLTLAEAALRALGGSLTLEARAEGGLRVVLTVPRAPEPLS